MLDQRPGFAPEIGPKQAQGTAVSQNRDRYEAADGEAEEEEDLHETHDGAPADDARGVIAGGSGDDGIASPYDQEQDEPSGEPPRLRELPRRARPVVRFQITPAGSVREVLPGARQLQAERFTLVRVIAAWIEARCGFDVLHTSDDWIRIPTFGSVTSFYAFAERLRGSPCFLGTEIDAMLAADRAAQEPLRTFAIELPGGAVICPQILMWPAYRKPETTFTRAAGNAIAAGRAPDATEFNRAAFVRARADRRRKREPKTESP